MHPFHRAALVGLGCVLAWSPLGAGTSRDWAVALTELLVLVTCVAWVSAMVAQRRLEWRRTALDLPVLLLVGLVLLQILLGDARLVGWALAPPSPVFAELPVPVWRLGTVSEAQTWRSLGMLLTYGAVYVLTVNLVREWRHVQRLVGMLMTLGGTLAFLGLLDYLLRERWWFGWVQPRVLRRLAGPFINPDHFATWLAMLVLLGLGLMLADRGSERHAESPTRWLASRSGREHLVRRYLPAIGVAVMLLALMFTLSRGALISMMGGLVCVLTLSAALGRTRWSLVIVGSLLAAVLGYASWIGLQPVVARFAEGQSRWAQLVSSLPMLGDFPLLGVGLGTYKDIYFRYQPSSLGAGKEFSAYAHNDLAQLVFELGPLGAALFLFAVWRVARDLVFAHLLGRARCPMEGEGGEIVQRHDPRSTGIAVGALGAVVVLIVHSAFDFSARIPANGLLGATCLGLATVALHTRFAQSGRFLSGVVSAPLWTWRWISWLIIGVSALALASLIVRPGFVEALLEPVGGTTVPARLDEALRWNPTHPRALALRAADRFRAARGVWDLGLDATGRAIAPEQRGKEAERLASQAIGDLRTAIAAVPTDPFLHEQLGWIYGARAMIDARGADSDVGHAVTHLRRAVVLAPQNPLFHKGLAVFALTRPSSLLPVGLEAGRQAVQHDPELLPELVSRFAEVALTESQWISLVPATWVDRLQLGSLLEAQRRFPEAASAYRDAVARAPAHDSVALWFLTRLLTETRQGRDALRQADRALSRDPDNPELHAARAQALAAVGDPAALDAFRAAAARADEVARQAAPDPLPFKLRPAAAFVAEARSAEMEVKRLQALLVTRLGQRVGPLRYHAMLGRYLMDRKLWEQAGVEWDAVLTQVPKDADAHFYRGQTWENLARLEQAIDEYLKAVALDPRPVFRQALASVLWGTQQYYQAMNEWRAILAEEPRNVEALVRLAEGHLKEGDRVAAFRGFQAVLQIVPDNPVALRELAKLRGVAR